MMSSISEKISIYSKHKVSRCIKYTCVIVYVYLLAHLEYMRWPTCRIGGGIDSKQESLYNLSSMGDIREGVSTAAVAVELLAAGVEGGDGISWWGGVLVKWSRN